MNARSAHALPVVLKRWLPAATWLALVATIIWIADTHRARWLFRWIETHPGSAKVGHFFLIGGMALVLNLALRRRCGPVLLGSVLVAIAFTCEEFSQRYFITRHFDWFDLAADFAGIALADWLARHLLFAQKEPRKFSE